MKKAAFNPAGSERKFVPLRDLESKEISCKWIYKSSMATLMELGHNDKMEKSRRASLAGTFTVCTYVLGESALQILERPNLCPWALFKASSWINSLVQTNRVYSFNLPLYERRQDHS